MAITDSAKKAHRAAQRRRVFNVRTTKAMKEAVKDAVRLVKGKSGKEAEGMLPKVYKTLDKAVKGGVIKKNAAARVKSRLAKSVRALVG